MKNAFARIPLLLAVMTLGLTLLASAQMRENVRTNTDLTGQVMRDTPVEPGTWENLFNMQMNHSYSMMFSSFGGEFQNVNAYTNTMQFFFSDRLTGRLDLSLLHSPFGNNGMIGGQSEGLGTEFLIRNAELNYQISDKSSIHLQFQQIPSMGMNPGSRYGNPFYRPYGSGFSSFGNY